ncbi:MAG: vitamin K epoxide reductase family protein, partial [Planctomycetota bacterium]
MDQGSEVTADRSGVAAGGRLAVGAMGLAVVAMGVSGYVTWASMRAGALPAGCGPGSGCAAVLASEWSRVMGVPVGVLAIWAYVVCWGENDKILAATLGAEIWEIDSIDGT